MGFSAGFRLENATPPRGQRGLRAGSKFFTKQRNALDLGIARCISVCAGLPPASRGRSHWWGWPGLGSFRFHHGSSSRDSRRRYSTYSGVLLYVTVGCLEGMGMRSIGPIAPHVVESRNLVQMSPPSVPHLFRRSVPRSDDSDA